MDIEGFIKQSQLHIQFCTWHRDLAGHLTTAVLFAFLLRQFAYHKRDMIFYTDAQVMWGTSLTEKELRNAKAEMKERLPFIKLTRQGADGRTHYSMDWAGLQRVLGLAQRAEPTPSDMPNGRNPLRENALEENTTLSQPAANAAGYATDCVVEGDGVAVGKQHPRWKKFAEKLRTAISLRHKVPYNASIRGWADSFYQLHNTDKVPHQEIKRVLDWYCKIYPDPPEFFPVADCGRAFRSKWVKILNAMEKAGKANPANRRHTNVLVPDPDAHGEYMRCWFDKDDNRVDTEHGLDAQGNKLKT